MSVGGSAMSMEKQNKLVDLSVSFAVEILNLVKFLKNQHETIISNQIGRAGTSMGEPISMKLSTLTARLILFPNYKLR